MAYLLAFYNVYNTILLTLCLTYDIMVDGLHKKPLPMGT